MSGRFADGVARRPLWAFHGLRGTFAPARRGLGTFRTSPRHCGSDRWGRTVCNELTAAPARPDCTDACRRQSNAGAVAETASQSLRRRASICTQTDRRRPCRLVRRFPGTGYPARHSLCHGRVRRDPERAARRTNSATAYPDTRTACCPMSARTGSRGGCVTFDRMKAD